MTPPQARDRIVLPARWRRSNLPDRYEIPFNLLVIADILGREDPRPIEDRKPHRVTRERFDKVKAEQKLAGAEPPIWDAVRRLAGEVDGMPRIEVELLNATWTDLLADFEDSPEVTKSGLFKLLYTSNYYGAYPYGAVLFDPTFELADRKLLGEIARVAALSHAPWIANPSAALAASDAWRALRASPDGAYLGTGDLVETAVKLARDFVATGYPEEAGGIDPRMLAASRVAQNLKVLRTVFMGAWRTTEAIETGLNGWLAEHTAFHDDGRRPFRVAHARVWGPDGAGPEDYRPRTFELELWTHAGPAAALGPIRIQGRIDME